MDLITQWVFKSKMARLRFTHDQRRPWFSILQVMYMLCFQNKRKQLKVQTTLQECWKQNTVQTSCFTAWLKVNASWTFPLSIRSRPIWFGESGIIFTFFIISFFFYFHTYSAVLLFNANILSHNHAILSAASDFGLYSLFWSLFRAPYTK